MNKKGFTLTELLVVIAIIGVLSVIIIPSVVKINKSINEREYEQRKTYVESAAETYASDKPDIFQGGDEAYVYVWQLLQENYLNADADNDNEACQSKAIDGGEVAEEGNRLSVGCVTDPRSSTSMNSQLVKLTKKTVGVVAELVKEETSTVDSSEGTLVKKVCQILNEQRNVTDKAKSFIGKAPDGSRCGCYISGNTIKLVKFSGSENEYAEPSNSNEVSSCILASDSATGNVDNWLKYGSSSANWRVIGLYKDGDNVYAKIITSSVVD